MRKCNSIIVLAVGIGLSPMGAAAAAPPGNITLDQLLSAPFPTSLVAAPAEGRVAWVFNAQGRRNVWVAEPPDYKGRALTNAVGDDGQELGGLAWTPDGRSLVYVRGNQVHKGEPLNPRSKPQVAHQTVWVSSLADGRRRLLGEGEYPSVSPRGSRVVFLRKGQVWWAPLDGSVKAEQLFQTRGSCRELRWAPDGSALAFVNDRGDHSFIGVYHERTQTIRWLDPSVDRDSDPAWSPDGKQIAFLRTPATRELFTFGPRRTAEPWSIRVADVASGQGRQVWKADTGTGSAFHGIDAANQLFWGAGDRIVFPWERDGWLHLYSVRVGGGPAQLLTPGQFEVESVALSPDRTHVLFNSNQDDIDRRHLWTVAVAGGPPTALTRGTGIEWAPTMTSDGKAIAFLRSDARRPAHPAIQIGTAAPRALAPGTIPAEFPLSALVEPQAVTITAADGMKVPGQLFLPPHAAKGERSPAVLYTHGGSRRQMLLGWHMMDGYHHHYALNQYLASRGFVVLSLNYRSGIGYGMEFREAPDYGAHGASEFNDVLGAGRYLRSRPDVDPRRVGLWGGSYGGYLTSLGLARASDLFAAGVNIHGVYDWNVVIRNFAPTYDPLVERQTAKRAFDASPAASVGSWRSPVLVIHGDQDPQVPFSESVRLVADLRKQGVDVEQLILPDEAHGFLTHRAWLRSLHATADYLERRLQPQPAEPAIVPKDAKVEKVAGDCKFTEGPAADADGNLFFTDSPNHRIMVLRPDGKLEVWDKASQDANGMRFDAKGRLMACCGEDGARAVVRYEKDGKKTILADRYNGKRLTAPNDLCVDRQGRIYFTDPCYGKRPRDGQEKYAVYRIEATADGEPIPNKVTRVIDDVEMPNGIALSPDQKTLYIADNVPGKNGAHTLVAYTIAVDGTCKRRAVLHDFKDHRGIDGMVVDTNGIIYATAETGERTGVYIFAPDGKQLGFIRTPETATNCTFGDKDLRTLYITAGRSLYKIRLNATGDLAYPKPRP